jgi:hypothetical protein
LINCHFGQLIVSSKDQFSWRLCCCFEVKFFYFLDILFICSMVDMNMSLPKFDWHSRIGHDGVTNDF